MAFFNPFLPSFREQPYAQYARLRAEPAAHYSPALQAWVLTTYAGCEAVLRDHERYSSRAEHARAPLTRALVQQRLESPLGDVPTVLNSDPPVQARLRAVVGRAFTPRVVEGLRSHIEDVTASLLDGAGERFDLMSTLAQPLPVIAIAELLGVPAVDRELFKRWSNAIAAATGVLNATPVVEQARHAAQELVDYFARVVEERRRAPREDIVSLLVRAEQDGEALSTDEMLAFCLLLLVAGNETTTNLIGNGMLALASTPEQWQTLRSGRVPAREAVEELLRYDSPVQGVVRFARAEGEVDGVRVVAGDTVLAMIGAANRDPVRFAEPDRLLLERADRRHLAFGHGVHFCLGAPLTRLEAEVAFSALAARCAQPRALEGGVVRGGTLLLRGLTRLEIVC